MSTFLIFYVHFKAGRSCKLVVFLANNGGFRTFAIPFAFLAVKPNDYKCSSHKSMCTSTFSSAV